MGVPMGNITCRFLSPSKVGEMLRLSLSVNRIGRSSLELNVTGTSGGEVRVQATLTVVVASLKNHRSVPIAADMRASLERYLVPPPG
jgi:4-hydroxybenzoyl-CoA thioesterase